MEQVQLNLGILAHVDAGKTTLTERLLYAAGVIDTLGSVDAGTTQTDSLALERERGITIKAGVVSFPLDGVSVNLIDTPGHPDFIAEVERVLGVLDGAVVVISAVEGVQPQTVVLMRALQRLEVATLLFVNKIDRPGADEGRVLAAIAKRLTPRALPVVVPRGLGTRAADIVPVWEEGDVAFTARLATAVTDGDDALLAAYLTEPSRVPYARLVEELVTQSRGGYLHPVFFGSALTGAGVETLMRGITRLLPATRGDRNGPLSGTAFKVERGAGGEKVAFVRMFSGTLRSRDRVRFGAGAGDRAEGPERAEGKVTALGVFDRGSARPAPSLGAGEIGKVWGLEKIRVGDAVGDPGGRAAAAARQFPPPTLESVVASERPGERAKLRLALTQLAEQDPLINVRQDTRNDLSVSLYGAVQEEVLQATLERDYGIEVTFREATPICIERPARAGEAVEVLHAESNPFNATLGMRVEPAAANSGVVLRLRVDPRTLPLYLYKTGENFAEHLDGWLRATLQEGLFGWTVTDCVVTLTRCTYSLADGPPSRRGPLSTPADFRCLTPLVLMQALQLAGTVVCEPILRASLEIPAGSVGSTMPALLRTGALVTATSTEGDFSTIEALVPAARANEVHRFLPEVTAGEGVLESRFDGYRPVTGAPPARERTTVDPRDREQYLASLGRRP